MKEKLQISRKKSFSSIEQAGNWLKKLKNQILRRVDPTDEIAPVNTDTFTERQRFLHYGISLLNPRDYPTTQRHKIVMFKNLLMAIVQGYTIEGIAQLSHCSLETAKKWEKEAIACVQDAIHRRRKSGIPIIGMN